MKKIILFGLLVFIGCMLVAGYQSGKFQFGTNSSLTQNPGGTPSPGTPPVPSLTPESPTGEVPREHLEVSIGNYGAVLPVFIDTVPVGNASPGTPLDISVDEGDHAVKVCDGSSCVEADVRIASGIKTAVDFSELLATKFPKGRLIVSIGDYPAAGLPVLVDNVSAGEVSFGRPLNMTVGEGTHTVKVCAGRICENESVDVLSAQPTTVDFGERLARDVPKGTLTVSIGGYNAVGLPVSVDTLAAGEVSLSKPLTIMVSEGRHSVTVCMDMICENESVDIQFAQHATVDFGIRLIKDAEFQKPTVQIVSSELSGSTYTVEVEFINPEVTDHTMTATIGSGYSYITSQSEPRKTDFAKTTVSRSVKAGSRQTVPVTLYLTKGSFPIASEPTVENVILE